MSKDFTKYGKSELGNFEVADTVGVPHPYCIGTKHVVHAADNFCGRLGADAIKDAEKHGAKCGIPNCNLPYEQHEQALLIKCKAELKIDGQINPELHAYLLRLKPQVEADGYAGFAFKR